MAGRHPDKTNLARLTSGINTLADSSQRALQRLQTTALSLNATFNTFGRSATRAFHSVARQQQALAQSNQKGLKSLQQTVQTISATLQTIGDKLGGGASTTHLLKGLNDYHGTYREHQKQVQIARNNAPDDPSAPAKLQQRWRNSDWSEAEINSAYAAATAAGLAAEKAWKHIDLLQNLAAYNDWGPATRQATDAQLLGMEKNGRITTADDAQLRTAGINICAILANAMHKSVQEIEQDLQAGRLGAEAVSTLLTQLGKDSQGAMDRKMNGSLEGQLIQLQKGLQAQFNRSMEQGLAGWLNKQASNLVQIVNRLNQPDEKGNSSLDGLVKIAATVGSILLALRGLGKITDFAGAIKKGITALFTAPGKALKTAWQWLLHGNPNKGVQPVFVTNWPAGFGGDGVIGDGGNGKRGKKGNKPNRRNRKGQPKPGRRQSGGGRGRGGKIKKLFSLLNPRRVLETSKQLAVKGREKLTQVGQAVRNAKPVQVLRQLASQGKDALVNVGQKVRNSKPVQVVRQLASQGKDALVSAGQKVRNFKPVQVVKQLASQGKDALVSAGQKVRNSKPVQVMGQLADKAKEKVAQGKDALGRVGQAVKNSSVVQAVKNSTVGKAAATVAQKGKGALKWIGSLLGIKTARKIASKVIRVGGPLIDAAVNLPTLLDENASAHDRGAAGGSMVGSVAGTAIGALGGPLGMAIGSTVGSMAGEYIGGLFGDFISKSEAAKTAQVPAPAQEPPQEQKVSAEAHLRLELPPGMYITRPNINEEGGMGLKVYTGSNYLAAV